MVREMPRRAHSLLSLPKNLHEFHPQVFSDHEQGSAESSLASMSLIDICPADPCLNGKTRQSSRKGDREALDCEYHGNPVFFD
jgi:hypothetical protein